ncbi:DUF1648 domain-containing protein [Halosimplex sp. TS25]|uniref:DUF1648 domain-containing protein n=1 Tax=Halosimplex rarum TaxID=3396619 RepID=UPI0039ECF1F6
MAFRSTRADWLSLAIGAATLAAGLAVWGRLPAEMAVHFSASGRPDNFVPKSVAIAALPALTVALPLFLDAVARFDPPEEPQVLEVVKVATTALLATVQGFVLAWNLGYDVPFDLFMAGVAIWAVALIGYSVAVERGYGPA